MHRLVILSFLMIPLCAFLQENTDAVNPYAKEIKPTTIGFAVRGKYWLLPGWEDWLMPSYSYGLELILNNRHCLGLDAGMTKVIRGWDDEMDVQMMTDFRWRRYLLVDYKYVFYDADDWLLYANSFMKFRGKYSEWTELEEYDFGNKDLSIYNSRIDGTYHDYGLGIGTKIYFGFSSFGFDASVNVVFRDGTYLKTTYTDSNTPPTYTTQSDDAVLPYVRFNFFYHFFSGR